MINFHGPVTIINNYGDGGNDNNKNKRKSFLQRVYEFLKKLEEVTKTYLWLKPIVIIPGLTLIAAYFGIHVGT